MPEGDAVWRTARRLDQALRGEPLVGVDLRWSRVTPAPLRAAVTQEVVPRGKHLLHRVEGGWTIHSHLRMDGSWTTRATSSITPRIAAHPDIRAIVATARTACIGWKLGMLDVIRTIDEHRLVSHLGPDLLGSDWDPERAVTNLRHRPTRDLGGALLDQTNLAGLGTIWTAESLHAVRLNPRATVDVVDDQRMTALVSAAHDLLQDAIGRRVHREQVYGRVGMPCLSCGSTIASIVVGDAPLDRRVAFCPGCQPG
ncbi:DNA-formamidopyrimidine glycosylase family protein [Calidifontibacter terrae]